MAMAKSKAGQGAATNLVRVEDLADGACAAWFPWRKTRFRLGQLMILVAALGVLLALGRNPIHRYLRRRGNVEWTRTSPFTAVQLRDDKVWVEFRGGTYQLISINKAPARQIVRSANLQFGELGEKRFVEDLPDVLSGMGFARTDSVDLWLKDEKGEGLFVLDAPMTAENRQQVYNAHKSGYKLRP